MALILGASGNGEKTVNSLLGVRSIQLKDPGEWVGNVRRKLEKSKGVSIRAYFHLNVSLATLEVPLQLLVNAIWFYVAESIVRARDSCMMQLTV